MLILSQTAHHRSVRNFIQFIEDDVRTLKDGQIRRIYSHLPVDDVDTFHALRLSGYEVEGVLKGPYRDGVDMFTVGKIISQ